MQKFEYPAKVLITTMGSNLTDGRRTLIALAVEQYLNLRQGFKDKNLGTIGVRVHLSMSDPKHQVAGTNLPEDFKKMLRDVLVRDKGELISTE